VILWQGDLIHGGGFDNKLKNGAMHLHLYIPMKPSDLRSLGGSVLQTVSRSGENFQKVVLDTAFAPDKRQEGEDGKNPKCDIRILGPF
jgi:hypothetical protein